MAPRKNALAAPAIFFSQNATTASMISAVVLIASILVQHKYKPYHSGGHKLVKADGKLKLAYDEESVGNFHSPSEKLELLCLCTLLATYSLGVLSSGLKPQEGSGAASFISLLALVAQFQPALAAWYFHSQEGKKDDAKAETEEAREPNPLAGMNLVAMPVS